MCPRNVDPTISHLKGYRMQTHVKCGQINTHIYIYIYLPIHSSACTRLLLASLPEVLLIDSARSCKGLCGKRWDRGGLLQGRGDRGFEATSTERTED